MAPRLTDGQIQQLVADYIEFKNYRAVARKHHVAAGTVKKYVSEQKDIAQKCAQKKEENTAKVLSYMESKTDLVCEIIGLSLSVLADPAKMAEATPAQITTALGTLIDKWAALEKVADRQQGEPDPITIALKEAFGK